MIIMANDAIFKSLLSCLLVLGISLATAAAPIATEFCVDLCRPVSEENIGNLFKIEEPNYGFGDLVKRDLLILYFRLLVDSLV